MYQIQLGKSGLMVPTVAVGCMRISEMNEKEVSAFVDTALEQGANFFDHADIYGAGKSELVFGKAIAPSMREKVIIQTKCGIISGKMFDFSYEHIMESVDGSLKRLGTEYIDVLLLHRPDALVEPEEVAEAFDQLEQSGKVRRFGVSNHKPMQIELLKKYVKQPLRFNQMQFSIPVSNMVANGLEVNMNSNGSVDRDGSVLDYCRLNDMTIQAWSPFQMPEWKGCFLGSDEYWQLNQEIRVLAEKYQVSDMAIATAWILRHPAKMQVIAGTTNLDRLKQIATGSQIELTREEWYKLYMAAGHPLP